MLIEKMSEDLKITKRHITKIIGNGNSYKKYTIPKRNHEVRTIYHPSKDLKILQKWIVDNVIKEYPVSGYSTAYENGCSVSKNALIHASNNFILHIDIKNFFESIKKINLYSLLDSSETKLDDIDKDFVYKIVMFKGGLTIGSVASPPIANRIMYFFDLSIVDKLSQIGNYTYTRYADDIVISSKKYITHDVISIVDQELSIIGLKRNNEKTYFTSKKHKRQINGIVIDNNIAKISYGSKKLQELKKEIYNYVLHDAENQKRIQLLGKLAYLKSVNNRQYESIVRKYINFKFGNKLFN